MLKTLSSEKIKQILFVILGLGSLVFIGLLFFRFPAHDETIYLQETMLMSELLKSGSWIGAYGVGLHGFLFKLPLALLFIFTGPSVILANLYNYVHCAVALVLVFKVSQKVFREEIYSWLIVLMTMFAFEFVRSAPTYLREMPSLISVLLFVYLYLKKEKSYLLGLALLLVLDAKEYMFFILGLSFSFSEFILLILNGISWKTFFKFVLNQIAVYSFSFVYLILMFTTTIIPVNMFVASIVGLIDRGLGWNAQQFSTDSGGNNVVNSGDVKEIFRLTTHTGNVLIDTIVKYINIGLGYIGKFLYPRSFSFISIPKLIAIPSFVSAFIYLKKWLKEKDGKVLIPVTIFVFLAIFILRNSHGRYLFSILPFILVTFVLFLKDIKVNLKLSLVVLAITWLAEMLGIYFETSMVLVKALISLGIFSSILLYVYLTLKNEKYSNVFLTILAIIISGITMLSSLAFMYTQGQIAETMKYGREYEMNLIVPHLTKYSHIYTNDNDTTKLLNFYIKDLYTIPTWKWNLKSYIPKASQVKAIGQERVTVALDIPFGNLINEEGSVFVLFESTVKGEEYQNQKTLPSLLTVDQIKLVEKIELKGKNIYIFIRNENNN